MFRELLRGPERSLVNDAVDEMLRMVAHGEHMFIAASAALLDGAPIPDVSKEDRDVQLGERMVRRLVFEHLAVNPQQDLAASLAVLGVVHDVERIGDYAKSLLELMKYGEACSEDSPYRQMCRELRDKVAPLFGKTLQGLRDSDGAACREVMRIHEEAKKQSDKVMDAVMADPGAGRAALLCATVSRYIRRVSAHLSNVASSVVNPLDQISHKEVTV